MFLREMFEAEESTVAIIFGRFNPPHKGHRAAWELASQADAWFVGTNKSTQGPKDPLPFDIKVQAMKAIMPEIEGHVMAETSWLTMASKIYESYPESTLLCLTDEEWVTKTILEYNGREGTHGYYNFKNIEQQPTPRLSSATALRDAVTKGDRQAFANAAGVPADMKVAGKSFFDLVAEYLLPYANVPKKVSKKKKEQEA
jgi:nicotinamide mononucleotide adenylyltransferase